MSNFHSLSPEALHSLSIEQLAERLHDFFATKAPDWAEVRSAEEDRDTARRLFLEADRRYQAALAAIHRNYGSGPHQLAGVPTSVVERPTTKGTTYFLRRHLPKG